MGELRGYFRVLLLILLSRLSLLLVELSHSIAAQRLQLLCVQTNLLRLLLDLVHEFSPRLEYLTSYTRQRNAERDERWKFDFDMEEERNKM